MIDRTRVIAGLCSTVAATTGCARAPTLSDLDLEDPRDASTESADASRAARARADANVGGANEVRDDAPVGAPSANSQPADAAPSATVFSDAGAMPATHVEASASPNALGTDAGATAAADSAAPAVPPSAPASSDEPAQAAAPRCAPPGDALAEDTSHPTTVVGDGSPASCTSSAVIDAVANGGVITFDCGLAPVTITLEQTAKVFNDRGDKVVIDGGDKITLSGGGRVRILYQNTCDEALVWTTPHCNNQEFPQLTVQNLTFSDGNASDTGSGGGAVYAVGGRLKVINSRFYNNVCAGTGSDVAGGAIHASQQYQGLPVHIVNSTFGGDASRSNVCSNGGALSSLAASYNILNSTFGDNRAIGSGANPARAGTPGGGSGGAIYGNGNSFTLSLCGSIFERNSANEGGGAIFFMSNDRTGRLIVDDSRLEQNPSGGFETMPGIFVVAQGEPALTNSVVR